MLNAYRETKGSPALQDPNAVQLSPEASMSVSSCQLEPPRESAHTSSPAPITLLRQSNIARNARVQLGIFEDDADDPDNPAKK